jgi:hypothetical protein
MVFLASKHLYSREPGCTSSNDNNLLWSWACRLATWLRFCMGALFSHEDLAVVLIDRPACNRTQGRGAQGFACTQVKTSVMPGTPNGIVNHDPLSEWTMVMGAMSADCKKLRAAANQQHLILIDMTENHFPVCDLLLRYTERQVRSGSFRLVSHLVTLSCGVFQRATDTVSPRGP